MPRLIILVLAASLTSGLSADASFVPQFLQGKDISLAYFGDFITHPAVTVSVPTTWKATDRYTLYRNIGGSFYTHQRNHNALMLTGELGNRISTKKGRFAELLLGAGYMHTWLQGDVYSRDDAGSVHESWDWGRPKMLLSLSLGAGWSSSNPDSRRDYFMRLVAFGEYPFNGILLPHLGLQVGSTFILPGGSND